MLANSAIQKLERYGQLGLKRNDVIKYVQSSLKDEKVSNAFALTRAHSWQDAAKGLLSRENTAVGSSPSDATECIDPFDSSPLIASEMLVYAAAFGASLLQVSHNSEYRGDGKIPACISSLTEVQTVEVIDAICAVLNAFTSSNVAASTSVTEAYGMLLHVLLDFALCLMTQQQQSSLLLEAVKRLLFVACSKFRGSYTAFPAASLLSIRTASALCKSAVAAKKRSLPIHTLPLIVKASAVENRCNDSKNSSQLDWALADNLCRVCSFALANRATRTVIYYRGDDIRLAQAEVTNHADYAAHSFALAAPIDCRFQNEPVAQDAARRWLESLPCLFKAFVCDAGWTLMAREQRRLKIQREAMRRQERSKKSKVSALSQSTVEGNNSNASSKGSALGDAAHLSSRGSTLSMGSTIVSIIKAREAGGTNDELLSVLDTVDAETRSVLSSMSHASATSYLSFMSVIDAAGVERDELQRHESADHNTNLALIFFEQIVLAISQLVESIDVATLTSSGLVDVAWKQIEALFVTLQVSLSPLDAGLVSSMPLNFRRALISLDSTPLFQFSHDMRYNGGLGYQTLGILFARIMSPLLDTEAESVPLIPTEGGIAAARAGTRWSQLRSRQQESALAACLGVYEAVAPQVINMHLKQIIRVVGSSLHQEGHQTDRARMLVLFLSRIVIRLGKSNSALSLLNILLQFAVTASIDEVQEALQLIRQPLIDQSITQSVEDCMDIESMLAFLGRATDLLQECNENVGDNEEERDVSQSTGDSRITLSLQLIACVGRGLLPTSLTSSIVVERIAEVDLLVSTFLTSLVDNVGGRKPTIVADALRSLISIRQVMDRCLVDLGATNMEQYLRVLEESLWQFETSTPLMAGTLTVPKLIEIVGDVPNGAAIVASLALQRLTQCHAVSTILNLMPAVRRDLKHLAVFVLETFAQDESSSLAMLRLSQAQWTALSCYGKKALIRTFVPVLRQQCVMGMNVEHFLGEWSTAAGDVLDALTVMLLEASPSSKELPVLLTAMSLLVRGRATVPRLPQVLRALIGILVDMGNEFEKSSKVADLIMLLLQCNRCATGLITKGAKAGAEESLRPSYVEYLADTDDLVEEAREAAEQLPQCYCSNSVAKLLLSGSVSSDSHARLLSFLYDLGITAPSSNKIVTSFCEFVITAILGLVKRGELEALSQFLSLQKVHRGPAKKRTREGTDSQASTPPFAQLASALLQRLQKTVTDGADASTFRCLRMLVLLGKGCSISKEECQSVMSISTLLPTLLRHGADGIVVALALGTTSQDDQIIKNVATAVHGVFDDQTTNVEGCAFPVVSSLISMLPAVVRSLGSDHAVVSTILHKTLRQALSRLKSSVPQSTSLVQTTLQCLIQLSRVSGFRFSSVKSHVKGILEVVMHSVALCGSADASFDVPNIRMMVQLLRLPLAQYHGDEVFVDLELSFVQLLPDYLAAAARESKAAMSECREVVKDVFHMLSSTFIDQHVFRHRVHLLAPLISSWFTHVLRGLDMEIYDGSVTGALASFFFRLTRTMHRSLDLSQSSSKETDVATLRLGVSTDALLLQQASIVSSMFTLSSKYLSVFARHGPELDFMAADTLKLLHREKLPDIFAPLHKKGETPRRNLSKSSFADLVFASVGSDEGRSILRQSLMSATDGDIAGGDSSIIFSAHERYMQ